MNRIRRKVPHKRGHHPHDHGNYAYLKNSGRASDMAMNATQPPMVIMIVFFTSWSPFCILKYTLNAPTSTMTAAMAFIRLATGVWYEEISVVALVKPPAPVLEAHVSMAASMNMTTNIAIFLAKSEEATLRVAEKSFMPLKA